jgi:16S rRNA (guanine527-N7)-methyltransferase
LERPRGPLPTRVEETDPLPEAYAATLDEGLRALGITLDADARAAIDGHLRMLLAWTAAINLTAIRDPVAAATLHVLDSLTALPILRARRVEGLLDIGSGGGYPGLPLAAAVPARALLVESIGKKAVFLRTAVEALGRHATIDVEAQRAEVLAEDPRDREAWPAVTARAIASLAEIAEIALPLLAPGGVLVAWKREPLGDEIDAARSLIGTLGGARPIVVPVELPALADHRLVVIEKVAATPRHFPRPPAERRRPMRTPARR